MLYKVNSNSNHCLFSELSSASTRVRHTRAAPAALPLEFEVSRCRTSQFAGSFLSAQDRMWNNLPYTVFDTGMLDGFKGAQSTVGCFSELCFLQFSVAQVLVGLRKLFINNFIFRTWACVACFDNNKGVLSSLLIRHRLCNQESQHGLFLWLLGLQSCYFLALVLQV